ncbi:MAG: DegT/DnrJ/EryC1/StrS family aminotransferase [Bdellovibrionales bacterium]|nr:DegT/DnrJ/EryC1/StrS family aminotransferase [Bdellovibrionales bacterium]
MINIFSNSLGNEELLAIKEVFASKWLGKGTECSMLESELAKHFNCEEVLLTNCCTSAIYIALKCHGIGKGDEVIIPTINFVAIASAVLELGATPVFADVDPNYFNLLPQEISRLKTNKTKAIFLLHYGGHPVSFDEIKAAAGDDVLIFEDSANAVASIYKGKACGTLGDAGVFSFDAMKILVMGDGGALIVKDELARARAKSQRYLGLGSKTRSGIDSSEGGADRWWEYDVELPAGRFISNDILASVGRQQLIKLPGFIERRKEIWQRYQDAFKSLAEVTRPPEPLPDTSGTYYLYWLRIPSKRDQLAHYLKEKGIYTTFRYYPLHLIDLYKSKENTLAPYAEIINETALNLPIHNSLTNEEQNYIIDTVKQFFEPVSVVVDQAASN